MVVQANRAACSTPIVTGSEVSPAWRSPSTALKSLSTMMPCAPSEYMNRISTTSTDGIAPSITAAPVNQLRPS